MRAISTEEVVSISTKVRNISDLARLAGVSPGTVSRALADKSLVNLETRKRIQALAREHGFRLNQMASKLRTQRTSVVSIIIPLGHDRHQHVSDPFFMTMLGYLADALTENGYQLMLSRILPDEPDWLERIVRSGMSDGALLIGQSDQFDAIEAVAAQYRPMVVWGEYRSGQQQCTVGTDNYQGGKLAAKHLISAGRRRLAFMGDIGPPEIAARYAGVCAAASEAGITQPTALFVPFAYEEIPEGVGRHLAVLDEGVDAVVAASDLIAIATVRSLADHGISVPGQVAVIGYDDLPLAGQTVPRLTTVRQDLARGSRAMIDALFARMRGGDAGSTVLVPELVVRDSA